MATVQLVAFNAASAVSADQQVGAASMIVLTGTLPISNSGGGLYFANTGLL